MCRTTEWNLNDPGARAIASDPTKYLFVDKLSLSAEITDNMLITKDFSRRRNSLFENLVADRLRRTSNNFVFYRTKSLRRNVTAFFFFLFFPRPVTLARAIATIQYVCDTRRRSWFCADAINFAIRSTYDRLATPSAARSLAAARRLKKSVPSFALAIGRFFLFYDRAAGAKNDELSFYIDRP